MGNSASGASSSSTTMTEDGIEWKIVGLNSINKKLMSETRTTKEGCPWRIMSKSPYPMLPKKPDDYLALYVDIDPSGPTAGWSFNANIQIDIVNQKTTSIEPAFHHRSQHVFNIKEPDWGWFRFATFRELIERGAIENDSIIIRAQIELLPPDLKIGRAHV